MWQRWEGMESGSRVEWRWSGLGGGRWTTIIAKLHVNFTSSLHFEIAPRHCKNKGISFSQHKAHSKHQNHANVFPIHYLMHLRNKQTLCLVPPQRIQRYRIGYLSLNAIQSLTHRPFLSPFNKSPGRCAGIVQGRKTET
jgi:hypothetical protein